MGHDMAQKKWEKNRVELVQLLKKRDSVEGGKAEQTKVCKLCSKINIFFKNKKIRYDAKQPIRVAWGVIV